MVNFPLSLTPNKLFKLSLSPNQGTVTLLELCDSLYIPQPKEKEIINEMFEREMRKEKNLEQIKKQ